MTEAEPLSCLDLIREGLVACGCCDSCHDDANEYGYDLIAVVLKDGRQAYVCCQVRNKLDEMGASE